MTRADRAASSVQDGPFDRRGRRRDAVRISAIRALRGEVTRQLVRSVDVATVRFARASLAAPANRPGSGESKVRGAKPGVPQSVARLSQLVQAACGAERARPSTGDRTAISSAKRPTSTKDARSELASAMKPIAGGPISIAP